MIPSYIGMIMGFGFGWAPREWTFCNGQLIPISSNSALFSLLGTSFGGDGRTTFKLPDLRGRVPIHQGQTPGGTEHPIGSIGGVEAHTLTTAQLPAHTHVADATSTLHAEIGVASKASATGRMLAGATIYADVDPADNKEMAPECVQTTVTVANAGGSALVGNMPPFQTISYCICTEGVYPSRN